MEENLPYLLHQYFQENVYLMPRLHYLRAFKECQIWFWMMVSFIWIWIQIEVLLLEQFSVNFGAKSDETFIWLTSNQYLTSQATTIFRGPIASNGESRL